MHCFMHRDHNVNCLIRPLTHFRFIHTPENKLWTDMEEMEHMKVTWWVSLQYHLGLNLCSHVKAFLFLRLELTMKDFIRWTNDKCRPRSFLFFYWISFFSLWFWPALQLSLSVLCSLKERVTQTAEIEEKRVSVNTSGDLVCQKPDSSFFPLPLSKIPSILSHLSHFPSSPSFLPPVAPRLSCLCVSSPPPHPLFSFFFFICNYSNM